MSSSLFPWPGEHLATVGVFDGLHLGHRAILDALVAAARRERVPALLITFSPRPITVLSPGTPPDELTPLPRKLRLLAEAGITRVAVLRFSAAFSRMEPEDFLTEILGAGAGLRGIWIGHDFRFGHGRKGGWEMLQTVAARLRIPAIRVDAIVRDGGTVSSNRIRERIRAGAIPEAARLLGRWPDLEGTVVAGRREGKRLLVATANLALPEGQCLPALGVYAGMAEWDGTWWPAVMNLGRRPTLTDGGLVVPEVHVLDLDQDLCGRRLLFQLRQRLREERSFPSLRELRDQIAADIAQTRALAASWVPPDSSLASACES